MRPAKNLWPATDSSRGVLFLAQEMRELLSPNSFESFRAMSLDSLSRILETISLVEDVQRGRIPMQALDPVIEELQWSLKSDPIAKTVASHEVEAFLEISKSKKTDAQTLLYLLEFIKKRLSGAYQNKLEQLILDLFIKNNRRIDFFNACQYYCAYMINKGFSKSYIYNEVNNRFFSGQIRRAGKKTLQSLFSLFEDKDHRFDVYVSVSSSFGTYIATLGYNIIRTNNVPAHVLSSIEGIEEHSTTNKILCCRTEAYDPYQAARNIEQQLTSIKALTLLAPKAMSCDWAMPMYVTRFRAETGILVTNSRIDFGQIAGTLSGRRLKALTRNTKRILKEFNPSSTERLLSSVNTSALARNSSNVENQLISIWSSVEVLLSEPSPNTPRIIHYENLLVPCVCLKYVRRKFVAVYDELLISYRHSFREIVSKVYADENIDQHTRFIYLLLLPEWELLRNELCELLKDNPLGLHRIWRMGDDYGSPKKALNSVQSHESRVKWQVHRIYRARNNLVHAGRVPSYIDGIVLNAFEYYRAAIVTIVSFAKQEANASDVDQTVAEVGFEYGIYKNNMQKMNDNIPLTKETVLQIVR